MSDQNEAITKFCDVSGVDEEQAKIYLEGAKNNLEMALHNFFAGAALPDEIEDAEDDDDVMVVEEERKPNQPPKDNSNRFQTVQNIRDSSSDEEETGQAFYAGGSTHSGQQVLGPPKSRNQIVAEMFRSVKEHGAEVVNQEPGSSKSSTMKFSGTGYRLGQTSNDTQVVGNGSERQQGGRQEMTITLKMWRQGFSIDDGPLRKYNDPANLRFLNTVSKGIIPDELLQQAQGHEVNLNMEDHGHEDYVMTKPKLKVFSGKGNILGSPVPGGQSAPVQAPLPAPSDQSSNETKAREAVPVDASQPTTSVQIRLADGSRLVGTFNHSHTVANLRTYITLARPEYAESNFILLTTFPSKELADGTATLADAGILNAALLQRLK